MSAGFELGPSDEEANWLATAPPLTRTCFGATNKLNIGYDLLYVPKTYHKQGTLLSPKYLFTKS